MFSTYLPPPVMIDYRRSQGMNQIVARNPGPRPFLVLREPPGQGLGFERVFCARDNDIGRHSARRTCLVGITFVPDAVKLRGRRRELHKCDMQFVEYSAILAPEAD